MQTLLTYCSKLSIAFIAVLFLLLSFWAQRLCDVDALSQKAILKQIEADLRPPLISASALKKISFGLDNTLADWYWIDLIQTINYWKGQSNSIEKKFDVITTLDPKFEYPYHLAIFLLPFFGRTEEAKGLAIRGMNSLPESWKIPYYLGVQLSYKGDNRSEALQYLDIARQKKDHEKVVDIAYAGVASKAGKIELARLLWEQIYLNEKDPVLKENALAWLRRIDMLQQIRAGIQSFYKNVGRPPTSLEEVVKMGYMREIPAEFSGYDFVISSDGNLEIRKFFKD